MCYAVFLATSKPLQTGEFIPGVTKIYLETPGEKALSGLRSKFSLPNIYYAGSDTKCSCGFVFYSERFDDPDWQEKDSPQALIDLLNELAADKPVEYYCCWEGDWDAPIEY